ncbi:hypothetical protein HanPI659440_Chr09g0352251 [Helianthus annuus]|nr:hypothetical protein HanPI659440_Chr09g0352251 [Helianthus annuus]
MLKFYKTIGTSHGLSCLYNILRAVICNPSIRKVVAVVVPNTVDDKIFNTELGFGVRRETIDPKIVKVTYIDRFTDIESVTSIPWQVKLLRLSTGAWKSPNSNLSRKSIIFGGQKGGVCVDGVCYWLPTERSTVDACWNSSL